MHINNDTNENNYEKRNHRKLENNNTGNETLTITIHDPIDNDIKYITVSERILTTFLPPSDKRPQKTGRP